MCINSTDSTGKKEAVPAVDNKIKSTAGLPLVHSSADITSDNASIRSKEIDRMLLHAAQEERNDRKVPKVLLLGPSTSGKSTFVKQLQLKYGTGFSEAEKFRYKSIILGHFLKAALSMLVSKIPMLKEKINGLLLVRETKKESLLDEWKDIQFDGNEGVESLPEDAVQILLLLSDNEPLRDIVRTLASRDIACSFDYFFSVRLKEIILPGWEPNDSDILNTRINTKAITLYKFKVTTDDNLVFIDVSGQKGARRKWLHYFQSCGTILFFAPIGLYNMNLVENPEINCLLDALALFDSLVQFKSLESVTFVVFLNMTDLFDAKVTKYPLKDYIPKYSGPDNPVEARKFVQNEFSSLWTKPETLFMYFTKANDRKAMNTVISVVTEGIFQKQMAKVGLM